MLQVIYFNLISVINPLASPSAGVSAIKYGDVNTVTPSPGEVKRLKSYLKKFLNEYKIFSEILIFNGF